jgi:hypothetical protein
MAMKISSSTMRSAGSATMFTIHLQVPATQSRQHGCSNRKIRAFSQGLKAYGRTRSEEAAPAGISDDWQSYLRG